MANYDYEIVNGRKIRVRLKETVSEIDKNGYFRRQPNHSTTPFGDGENDLKAEGNKRYRLVWAKLCHWSNRAAIVRELEGLEDQISVNMVEHAPHEKNLGWEYVYNENNIDPVFGDQFLSEAYYRADDVNRKNDRSGADRHNDGKGSQQRLQLADHLFRGQLPPMAQKRRAGAVSGGAAGRG